MLKVLDLFEWIDYDLIERMIHCLYFDIDETLLCLVFLCFHVIIVYIRNKSAIDSTTIYSVNR